MGNLNLLPQSLLKDMSSYLNIYLKPDYNNKKLLLMSFGRSSDIYKAFCENVDIAYASSQNDDEKQYTQLETSDIRDVIAIAKEDLNKAQKTLEAYKKYLTKDEDVVLAILDMEEDVEDKKSTINTLQFLYDIAGDIDCECNSFGGMYANID